MKIMEGGYANEYNITEKAMSEEDIKLQYITPAITSKWDRDKITMETRITDGKINLKGNFVFREKPKRADYILYLNANNPIAIIEAKDNKHSISHGLQQAMTYAQMLDLPFAYSSNGDGFAEHDFLTGKERQFALDEFPTEDELIARFKQESGMTPAQEAVIEQSYYSSQNTYPPRYYQRIAINRTVDAIARGQNRLLLVMATGTGKTYGATPGGILEHPGTVKDPQRVRESWTAAFDGSSNANKVAVLEEGMKYTPISISPEQAQFLETRKFQINEIARIFRVPPHMVGDLEKSSFSNIEQQSLEFVKYTLDPWVARWEQAIVRSLFSTDEKTQYFVKFNVDGLLRGDYQSRMNGYAIGRQNGWMSANDIRELENLDRIPEEEGGDLYLINGNMTKLKDAGIFAGKESEPNEEVLEVEEPKGSESGDTDGNGGEDTVPKRHHRRG